jgi:group I intron endonuclease
MPRAASTCGVYAIRRDITNEYYVGQSVNIVGRWGSHLSALKKGNHASIRMQRVYNKSPGSLHFIPLEEGIDPTDKAALTNAEQFWIDVLKPCYNTAPAAISTSGYKWNEESRLRCSVAQKLRFSNPEARKLISEAKMGCPSPWKGKVASLETRIKQSAAKKGKTSTFKGRKHTPEAIAKISASKKGVPSPNRGKTRSAEANAKQSASMKLRFQRLHEMASEGALPCQLS